MQFQTGPSKALTLTLGVALTHLFPQDMAGLRKSLGGGGIK